MSSKNLNELVYVYTTFIINEAYIYLYLKKNTFLEWIE
jgi:hypothetical protein